MKYQPKIRNVALINHTWKNTLGNILPDGEAEKNSKVKVKLHNFHVVSLVKLQKIGLQIYIFTAFLLHQSSVKVHYFTVSLKIELKFNLT